MKNYNQANFKGSLRCLRWGAFMAGGGHAYCHTHEEVERVERATWKFPQVRGPEYRTPIIGTLQKVPLFWESPT